jgi:hypothetical protein
MRNVRMANGRYELPQSTDGDFIPADARWLPPTRKLSVVPDTVSRSVKVTSRYDKEKQEIVISLNYACPSNEKPAINEAIKFARRQGPLRRIVLVIAAEVFATPAAYHFCRHNGFVRNEGRENDLAGFLVLEKVPRGSK